MNGKAILGLALVTGAIVYIATSKKKPVQDTLPGTGTTNTNAHAATSTYKQGDRAWYKDKKIYISHYMGNNMYSILNTGTTPPQTLVVNAAELKPV